MRLQACLAITGAVLMTCGVVAPAAAAEGRSGNKTVASAYTPVSLDARGRVYAQNNGELYVLGS